MKAFAGNDDVSFADVNLQENRISGPPHNPGSGGWPTIRYFNKDTGLEGGNYVKKTDKSMCDELGDEETMTAYVEDYGNTALCSVSSGSGCDERQLGYIEKMKKKTSEDHSKELNRLEGMSDDVMKPELKSWISKRKKILKQLVASAKDEL